MLHSILSMGKSHEFPPPPSDNPASSELSGSQRHSGMKGDIEMTDDYKKGFADQTKEITAPLLEVEGVSGRPTESEFSTLDRY